MGRRGCAERITCGRASDPCRIPTLGGRFGGSGCDQPAGSGSRIKPGQSTGRSERSHTDYERFHLTARLAANRREAAVASFPCSPSTENTRGVKVRRRAMHRAPYLSFFSFSCRRRTFSGAVLQFDGASVSVTRTSKIAVVPWVQNPWTAMLPRSSGADLVRVDPAACTSRLDWMSGFSETVEGVRAWLQIWPHTAMRLLWRWRMRPPLRQDMACLVVNRSPYPLHRGGRALGVKPKRRRTPSQKLSAERSEALSRLGMVVSHAPAVAGLRIRRFSIGRTPDRSAFKRPLWVARWPVLAARC